MITVPPLSPLSTPVRVLAPKEKQSNPSLNAEPSADRTTPRAFARGVDFCRGYGKIEMEEMGCFEPQKEVKDMSDKELVKEMIDKYTDLQRIEIADDPRKEVENQKRVLEAKLHAFGIVTDEIRINRA